MAFRNVSRPSAVSWTTSCRRSASARWRVTRPRFSRVQRAGDALARRESGDPADLLLGEAVEDPQGIEDAESGPGQAQWPVRVPLEVLHQPGVQAGEVGDHLDRVEHPRVRRPQSRWPWRSRSENRGYGALAGPHGGEHCPSRSLASRGADADAGGPDATTRARSASTGDDRVFHRADAGDLGAQDHAVVQVQPRGAADAAAGRGAGEDQVAGSNVTRLDSQAISSGTLKMRSDVRPRCTSRSSTWPATSMSSRSSNSSRVTR